MENTESSPDLEANSLCSGYVLPLSFIIPASCSRYTGHGIGTASCCTDLTSPLSRTEWTEGSPPFTHCPRSKQGKWHLQGKAPAQLSSELSRSLSEQAAEQAAEQAGLDFPLYCNHIHCKRNLLQQTPLLRKGSPWVERSQQHTCSILRVRSGEKEYNQDITDLLSLPSTINTDNDKAPSNLYLTQRKKRTGQKSYF